MSSDNAVPTPTSKKIPTRLQIVLGVIGAFIFIIPGSFELQRTRALLRSQSTIGAKVIGHRVSATRGGQRYQVNYIFSPTPGAPGVRRKDFMGIDSWSSLPQRHWQKVVDSGELVVRFDPANPTNSIPVLSLLDPWDSAPFILGGGFVLLFHIGLAWRRQSMLKEQAV